MNNQLKQQLGLFSAVMVVISAMIGSGVFKKIAPMSNELNSSMLVLGAWAVAGVITWMGSLSNAEVAGLIAQPGGQYVYFRNMYGKLFAFLFGWSSFSVIQTSTAAAVAYIFAESLNSLVPLPELPADIANITLFSSPDFSLMPFHNFGVKSVACLLVIILSVINYRGIEYGERISNIFGVTVVIGVLTIIIIGFIKGSQPLQSISLSADAAKGFSISAFFTAMMAAFWAYEGWNNVGFLAGEIKNPKRNIPIALGLGTLVVMALYTTVNASFYKMADVDFYKEISGQSNTIAAVAGMQQVWEYGALFISGLILVSTLNSTNNSLMSAPRIYYAMACDKLFFDNASHTHPKYKTPHKAIIMQMFWCVMLIISGSFDMLTEMLVFVAFIFYGCGAFGVIILRKKMPDSERPFKVPLYPVLPILFSLFSLALVINTLIESPVKSAIGLGLVAAGLPLYFLLNKKVRATT